MIGFTRFLVGVIFLFVLMIGIATTQANERHRSRVGPVGFRSHSHVAGRSCAGAVSSTRSRSYSARSCRGGRCP